MAESEEDRHLKLTGEFDCDASPLSTLRHSTSHVMAQAVKRLFPDVKVAIGPAIEDGFYYDFGRAEPFTPDDLARIERVMAEIVKADLPFERQELSRAEAIAFFRERGERFKVEIVEGIDAERVSLYTQGEFVDLCRGPHVARRPTSTGTSGGWRRPRSATTASSVASWTCSTSTTSRPARPSGCPTGWSSSASWRSSRASAWTPRATRRSPPRCS
jgi:hypothetical protein